MSKTTDDLGHLVVSDLSRKQRAIAKGLERARPGSMQSALEAARDILENHQADRAAYRSVSHALTDLSDAVSMLMHASTPQKRDEAIAALQEAQRKAIPLRDALDLPRLPFEPEDAKQDEERGR